MKKVLPVTAGLLSLLTLTSMPASAESNPYRNYRIAPQIAEANTLNIVLDEVAKRLIGNYYQTSYQAWLVQQQPAQGKNKNKTKAKGLPPGLAKKGKLPPGIQQQLVRNGTLPPGLTLQPLPRDLVVQLPALPAGTEVGIVDNRVLLVQRATNLVLDVLEVAAAE